MAACAFKKFLCTGLLISAFSLKAQECPSSQKLPWSSLNHPLGIQGWLKTVGSQVKTIDQFICCLPNEFKKRTIISPTSLAGQNGTPNSPRVFLLGSNPLEKGLNSTDPTLVLTTNAGGPHSQQGQSIEIAHFDQKTGEVAYYDLDFSSGSPKLSSKNPSLCMGCHGENGNQPKAGGAKPIFEPFGGWQRMIGGTVVCSPIEDKLQTIAQKTALKTVLTHPRFKCLDKSLIQSKLENFRLNATGFDNDGGALIDLDRTVIEFNSRRVAELIKQTPNWRNYIFILYGESQDCPVSENLTHWLPREVIESHSFQENLYPELKGELTQEKIDRLWDRLQAQGEKHRAFLHKLSQDPLSLTERGFPLAEDHFQCTHDPESEYLETPPNLKELKKIFGKAEERIIPFLVDSLARHTPGNVRGVTSPLQRFIFEGRGISMENWSPDLRSGKYHVSIEFNEESLLWSDKALSDQIKKIKKENPLPENFSDQKKLDKAEEKFCKALAKASYMSLQKLIPLKKKQHLTPEHVKGAR